MAPARGNQNALKHGQRCRIGTIGGCGKGTGYASVAVRKVLTALENAVVDAHGEIDVTRSALINSACRWEKVAQLSTRWLKQEGDKLPVGDRLNLVRGIAQASDNRDKCIKSLGIETKSATDVLAHAYTLPLTPAAEPKGEQPDTAPDATAPTPAAKEGA